MVTVKQTKTFHKKKRNIGKVILSKTGKNEVIYGAQALNKRFPPYLQKHTTDYDILTKNPKKEARQTERALDRHMGFNAFKTEPAIYEGTHRVRSNVTGEVYADYTKSEKKVPYDRIGKHNYVKLGHVKKTIKKTLRDPEAAFRHAKDQDSYNRIKIYEREKGSRKRKPITFKNHFKKLMLG